MKNEDIYAPGENWKSGSKAKEQRVLLYVEWILTPKSERVPGTKKEFAAELDVSVQTLANYEKDILFQSELDKRSRSSFKATAMPDVISTMVKVATDADNPRSVQAARLLLEWQDKVSKENTLDLDSLDLHKLWELFEKYVEPGK